MQGKGETMFSSVQGIQVVGMSAAVSNTWDSLLDISDEDEKVLQKFIKKIGVKGRWSASQKQTTSDFCFAAAEALLNEKGIDRSEIGVLVFVTQTPDYGIPATGCVLQMRLGLPKNTIAFDVNLGCSGFTYGMEIASALLNISDCRYALLLAGDTSAREKSLRNIQKTSHSAALLFGDSGTATLLEKTGNEKLLFASATDGEGFRAIISPYGQWRNPDRPDTEPAGTRMNDVDVFNFATTEVPTQLKAYMEHEGATPESYDDLVLHQANLMILKQIAKKTGFPLEKVPISMDRFGNTSSSSIPITIVDKYGECEDNEEIRELCCGFGVGLSWSTVDLRLQTKDILPLIHTDEFFVDGYPAPEED